MRISSDRGLLNLSMLQSRLLALFISVAIFVSISTNLRVSALPVGVGEVSLLLMSIAAGFLKPWQQIKSPLFIFWVAVWLFTALGWVFGNVVGNLRMHNTVAYVYTGLLTLAFLTIFSRLSSKDLRRILVCFVLISVGALWLGLFAYVSLDQSVLEFLRIDIIHERYQGWCQNANQMSLLLVPTPFLVTYLWFTSRKSALQNLGWAVVLLLSVGMGLIVRSDALGFSWILGMIILIGVGLRNGGWIDRKYLVGLLLIFVTGFFGVRLAAEQGWLGQPAQNSLYAKEHVLEKLRIGHGETDQKVGIRLQLWKNALGVWEKSPIFGHGPGAYSAFDLSDTQSFTGMEAHNTLIDLMVQGGILLGLAYVAIFLWLMLTLWRSRQWLLLISALMIFSFEFFMFHLRQPVLWFYLVMIWALATDSLGTDKRHVA